MTDKMIQKARNNAEKYCYKNVEFRKGDIEKRIPVEDNIPISISTQTINF
jgi:arsenite methyltransferase